MAVFAAASLAAASLAVSVHAEEIPFDKSDSGKMTGNQKHITMLEHTESGITGYSAVDFVFDGVSTFTLPDASETLMDAGATAGGNTGIAIHFISPMTEGYSVTFTFTDSDGNNIPVVIEDDKPNDSDTLFVKIRGLIGASGISAADITKLSVTGSDLISFIEISTGDSDYFEYLFAQNDPSADGDESGENPKTGTDMAQILLFAAAAGAVAGIFGKYRDTADR